MAYGLSNGHVTNWRHVTPKRCCEAVRSTILATAWLLVLSVLSVLTFYVLFRVLFVYFIFLYCFLLFICVRLTCDLINASYLLSYWFARLLSFRRPFLSVDVSVRLCRHMKEQFGRRFNLAAQPQRLAMWLLLSRLHAVPELDSTPINKLTDDKRSIVFDGAVRSPCWQLWC